MIPEFPKFKKLELSDKADVEAFTHKYPPYSDFNFTSMWSWNIKDEMSISQMNNNFVVRFTDYVTGKPFLSFLGTNKVNETAQALLEFSKSEGLEEQMKLIPEDVIKHLNKEQFKIQEDRDNHDYIFSVEKLKPRASAGRKLSTRRKIVNRLRQLSHYSVTPIDLNDKTVKEKIEKVSLVWEEQRGIAEKDARHLSRAMNRILTMEHSKNTLSLGVFIREQFVGYSINEIVNDEYAMGDFQQADLKSSLGIYAFLMEETGLYLDKIGCKYINLEQDLGIPGLRKWKMSYHHDFFLKKYIVSL
ncbi:MAG: phosphatidylglycerol lysyltransferase domain-containing protein [Candidatus Pacebacteria bacterium]|nr:phosphatidylglycerol lysyltransferase domain-containing protein [Candidatus Paceibacterota bacterium]